MIKLIAFLILDYFSETKLEVIYDEEDNAFSLEDVFGANYKGHTVIYCNNENSDNDIKVYTHKGVIFSIKINCLNKKFEGKIMGEKLTGRVSHPHTGYYVGTDCIYLDYLGERTLFVTY